MSQYGFDGTVYISDDTVLATSSADYHQWMMDGDTVRICTDRTITNSNDDGYKGEICWDSNYLYICVANNTWKRVALSSW